MKTWGTVAVSGLLIIAALLTGVDLLMIAAAVVAGWRIAVSAWQALRIRLISIDLLVVVAAVGALFINNYWESAAVTFLFALGKALEKATLNRTRRALSDLVEAAPETATLLRDGEPVINDVGLAALALLVAESDPKSKEVMIRLIENMLAPSQIRTNP